MHVARRIFSMAEVVVYLQSTSGLQVVDCARFGNKEPLVLFYGRYDRTQGLTPVSALHSVLSNSEAQFWNQEAPKIVGKNSDQMSQVSKIAFWRCSRNVFVFVFVIVFFGQVMSPHPSAQMS